jgi:hypothetical protein
MKAWEHVFENCYPFGRNHSPGHEEAMNEYSVLCERLMKGLHRTPVAFFLHKMIKKG